MTKQEITSAVAELVGVIAVISFVISFILFMMTFLIGAATSENREPACQEINLNIERVWPVRAACWFWKTP